jgi:hypothetical protein
MVLALVGIIPILVAGCIITRSFEPKFEVVSLSIAPEPLRRQQVKDPIEEDDAVIVAPDSVLTFKNLRKVPCRITEYSIEYTFLAWSVLPGEDYEGKNISEVNKDLAKFNRSGNLSLYLEEEEKTVNLRIAWGATGTLGSMVVSPGELYGYMLNPNWDADDPPVPGDDPDIEVKAKITVTGVDEYSKLIEAEAAVSINTDILVVTEEEE